MDNTSFKVLAMLALQPLLALPELPEVFTELEKKHFDTLFHSWRNEGDSFDFDEHFLKLFMKIEAELIKTMQRDCDEKTKEIE